MNQRDERIVSVFGSGEPREGDAEYSVAMAVGRKLAELGYAIANGGYGGTMEASSRGASQVGGQIIGVTCSIWKSSPNRFITREIRTTSLADRVGKLIEAGTCGYVCLAGSTGTLVELASVWEMMFKGMLPRRPLVCVGDFWKPLIDLMVTARSRSAGFVNVAENPDQLEQFFPPV